MTPARLLSCSVSATLVSMLLASPAPAVEASPAPFANGDAAIGKTLAERDCVACHARQMAGDADKMYLRADRRVNTPQKLLAQVSYCNAELGTHYFPDEEEHIAAYLNARYYKFKP